MWMGRSHPESSFIFIVIIFLFINQWEIVIFNLFLAAFNITEHPYNATVPVISYVTAAVNTCSFPLKSMETENNVKQTNK